jgi:putative membrane protein
MGLCIVPCLYAWFNVFSNWDPYGSDATSRIRVAVVSEDKGAELLGLKLNVGDSVIEALESNDQIGWVFVDTKQEALELVYSSDCYAALVVPKTFSKDIVSFVSLQFNHPTLQYYENGKKNAIAPKITSQAKTTVQQQVNTTFLQTLVSVAAEVVETLDANGISIEDALDDLSNTIVKMAGKLEEANATLRYVQSIATSAKTMAAASGILVADAAGSIGLASDLLIGMVNGVSASDTTTDGTTTDGTTTDGTTTGGTTTDGTTTGGTTTDGTTTDGTSTDGSGEENVSAQGIASNLAAVSDNMSTFRVQLLAAGESPESYNTFVNENKNGIVAQTIAMSTAADSIADSGEELGLVDLSSYARALADTMDSLTESVSAMDAIDTSDSTAWEQTQEQLAAAEETTDAAANQSGTVSDVIGNIDTDKIIENATGTTISIANNAKQLMSAIEKYSRALALDLDSLSGSFAAMGSGLRSTMQVINEAHDQLLELADFIDALAHSEFLQEVLDFLREGSDTIDGHIASPIQVETEVMYPAEGNYGSQMSPFYTMLAQWVGALFSAVIIKTPLRNVDPKRRITMPQHYFGRMGLYLFVGITQALITSLGDLYYVGIVCMYPGRFVLAAVASGICFTLINYMLVFTMGAAGLAASVIVMVLQVAGAGGTYPVEVVPKIFQILYPFMPFKFGMNAMREAVSGLYGTYYRDNILTLFAIAAATIPAAFIVYKPGKFLNDLLEKAKHKTGIMT